LRNIKDKTILEKKASESAHPMICLLLQVMTPYQENNNQTACWVLCWL